MPVLDFPSAHMGEEALQKLPSVATAMLHGNLPSTTLGNAALRDLRSKDFVYTLSIMLSPDDVDQQQRLCDAYSAEAMLYTVECLNLIGAPSVCMSDTLSIAHREDYGTVEEELLKKCGIGGAASGWILRWIVSRWRYPKLRREASLGKAAKAFSNWCKANKIQGTTPQHISRNIWPRYRSVAHLWAALSLVMDCGSDDDDDWRL